MLKVCYGKVKGHELLQNLQATHVTHTHTHIKQAEEKNSSILLQYAECGTNQLCCEYMYVYVSGSVRVRAT